MLAAVCRIGHKYQASDAVEAAAARIQDFFVSWPRTISMLSSRRDPLPMPVTWELFWEVHHRRHPTLGVAVSDAFEAVSLARLLDKPSMLPFAFYLCCVGDPLHLRDGAPREDGSFERLSSEDYLRCIQAVPKILAACSDDVRSALARYKEPSARYSCAAEGKCTEVFQMMHAEFVEESYAPSPKDLLMSMRSKKAKPAAYMRYHGRLCITCLSRLDEVGRSGQVSFMKRIFDL